MEKFVFFRALGLYIKLIDLEEYVETCRPLEQTENQKVILWLIRWTEEFKQHLVDEILENYQDLSTASKSNIPLYFEHWWDVHLKFSKLIQNLKFLPVAPPLFTLKTMVQEAENTLRVNGEEKIDNSCFKTIPEFNFYESPLVDPKVTISKSKQLKKIVSGKIPIVQSMSILYHKNPLMWPIIFHEYGHYVNDKNSILDPITLSELKKSAKLKGIVDNNGDPNEKMIKGLFSEIFSDLYAVKCCGSNFVCAFYFQEILTRDSYDLLNTDRNKIFSYDNLHPPSYLRFLFILEEIKKYGSCKNDKLIEIIEMINQPFDNIISEIIKDNVPPKNYRDFLDEIYQIASNSITRDDFDTNWGLIDDMYTDLSKNYPIGTKYRGESLAKALAPYKEEFDIDKPNQINDIIYTGWKYLIEGLFEKFYNGDQVNYPIKLTEEEKKDKTKQDKDNFTDDYIFLIKNINYSIETSVIVSNYGVKYERSIT